MPDYQEGKIYKIVSDGYDKIYIGSTTTHYLSTRLNEHRQRYKKWINGDIKYDCTSFDVMLYNEPHNAKIILLESFPCNTSDELKAREEYWRKQYDNCVNKFRAIRKKEPSYYHKKYYQKNRDARLKYQKEYSLKKKALKQE